MERARHSMDEKVTAFDLRKPTYRPENCIPCFQRPHHCCFRRRLRGAMVPSCFFAFKMNANR